MVMGVLHGMVCQLNYHGGGIVAARGSQQYAFRSSKHQLQIGQDVVFDVASGEATRVSPESLQTEDWKAKPKSLPSGLRGLQTRTCSMLYKTFAWFHAVFIPFHVDLSDSL